MANYKINVAKMDEIIKKTVEAIDNSKKEIYDIAENARRECKKLEDELQQLKQQVAELIQSVDQIETELKESKKRLMLVNKNFEKYTQQQLREAYEKADNLRIELAIKREQEQFYIKRRNDLEVRMKEAYKTVEKADNLISQVGVALGYLSGGLMEITLQLEDMQQRQLLGLRIIKAQEEERQRVARDIHDGPAQSMSNVVLKAEICERLIDVDVQKAKGELQHLKRIVRESLQDVRKIIYNLRPMSLDDLGLIPTLQRFISTYEEEEKVTVSFKTRGNCDNLKPIISLTVFRIVQEAMSNVHRHAMAKNTIINLEITQTELRMIIFDDGKGFDINKVKARGEDLNSGFGLYNMRERVELLDGKFEISSAIGKGTRLNIVIPLNQEEEGVNE